MRRQQADVIGWGAASARASLEANTTACDFRQFLQRQSILVTETFWGSKSGNLFAPI
jgi:hypothetical protein